MDDPKLELHPEAAKAFNAAAERLAKQFGKWSPTSLPRSPADLRPDVHVSWNLTEKDIIGEVGLSEFALPVREEVSRGYTHGAEMVGLGPEAFEQLMELVARVQATRPFFSTVSTECLLDVSFRWLIERHDHATESPFVDYMVPEVGKRIRRVEVWLPVHKLYIESHFGIGRVVFKTLTREMLDAYERQPVASEEARIAVEQHFRQIRKRFQGVAAATFETVAEPTRAHEIAREEARMSLALLRFFEMVNSSPDQRSYCTLQGEENLTIGEHFVVEDGRVKEHSSKVFLQGLSTIVLNSATISQLSASGLDTLGAMLRKESTTDFESTLLSSVVLYATSTLTADPSEKLVYIFAALESMLLKDASEPIAKNIGERMAWLAGSNPKERLEIVRLVTDVYGMRSGFVHYGRPAGDLEIMARFMHYAWSAFKVLIRQTAAFPTKAALIVELERRKMS